MLEVPELTDGEFEQFIRSGVVLIDFFAEWCMPCMMMSPIVEDIANKFLDNIKVGKINIDDSSLTSKFEIVSIPTFIIFKDGKIVKEISGALTEEELSEEIEKFL